MQVDNSNSIDTEKIIACRDEGSDRSQSIENLNAESDIGEFKV